MLRRLLHRLEPSAVFRRAANTHRMFTGPNIQARKVAPTSVHSQAKKEALQVPHSPPKLPKVALGQYIWAALRSEHQVSERRYIFGPPVFRMQLLRYLHPAPRCSRLPLACVPLLGSQQVCNKLVNQSFVAFVRNAWPTFFTSFVLLFR